MKKVMLLLFVLLAVIVFSCTACGKASMNTSTPASTSDSEQEEEANDSEGSLGVPVINKQEENPPDDPEPDEPVKKHNIRNPASLS